MLNFIQSIQDGEPIKFQPSSNCFGKKNSSHQNQKNLNLNLQEITNQLQED
jgi:predicted house-cleaning noncanonical NTP pyrophosphatase (MazG superfamily)